MNETTKIAIVIVVIVVIIFVLIYTFFTRSSNVPAFSPVSPSNNPPPSGPSEYEVTFLNSTNETLLLGAAGPSAVLPREGTWNLLPNSTLTIDIPQDWLQTQLNPTTGPRFWARSGCRYNKEDNKAVCEIGTCGGAYDCSGVGLAGKAPVSLAEFCFDCGNNFTYYDVSLVDGYSLSIDIQPMGFTQTNPLNPNDPFWCKTGLCNAKMDLRESCPDDFSLKSSNLPTYIPGQQDNIVACFSNCGKFEYPVAPTSNCDEKTDPQCAGWRKYCCQAPDFGRPCTSDNNCSNGGACWTGNQRPISPANPALCQCRAYYRNLSCPSNVCTNPEAMPQPSVCTDCIGDDTMHEVCSRAYTWPNDPQTYNCNAKKYLITFAPGGTTMPVTPSTPIPKCSTLPSSFNYNQAKISCGGVTSKYACATQTGSWQCDSDSPNAGCAGVICERD